MGFMIPVVGESVERRFFNALMLSSFTMREKNLMPYWKAFVHPALEFRRVRMARIEIELTNLCLDLYLLALNSYTIGSV